MCVYPLKNNFGSFRCWKKKKDSWQIRFQLLPRWLLAWWRLGLSPFARLIVFTASCLVLGFLFVLLEQKNTPCALLGGGLSPFITNCQDWGESQHAYLLQTKLFRMIVLPKRMIRITVLANYMMSWFISGIYTSSVIWVYCWYFQ